MEYVQVHVPGHPLWSNEMDAFCRTIDRNPEDDLPAMVFADWLDEMGLPSAANDVRQNVAQRVILTDEFAFASDLIHRDRLFLLEMDAVISNARMDAYQAAASMSRTSSALASSK